MNCSPCASVLLICFLCTGAGHGMTAHAKCVPLPEVSQPMYRGVLKSSGGKVVADGSYRLTLRIYEQPEGGIPVWEAVRVAKTRKGAYTIALTSPRADSVPLPELENRYISILPPAPIPEQPRQRLRRPMIPVNAEQLMAAAGPEGRTPPDRKTLDCIQTRLDNYHRTYWSVPAAPLNLPKPPDRVGPSFTDQFQLFNALLRKQSGGKVAISCRSAPCLLHLDVNGDARGDLAVQVASADGRPGVAVQLSDERIEVLGAGTPVRLPVQLQSLKNWQVVGSSSLEKAPADMTGEGIYVPGQGTGILMYGTKDGLRFGGPTVRLRNKP